MASAVLHRVSGQADGNRPTVVLIPGGGCFSGASLGPVDILSKAFNVIVVDPPGTGKAPKEKVYTYHDVVAAIEDELKKIQAPMIISGHSFGAIYAADLVTRDSISHPIGFMNIAGVISVTAAEMIGPHVRKTTLAEATKAEEAFFANSNEESWKRNLEQSVPYYFTKPYYEKGRELIVNDISEYRCYLEVAIPYLTGKLGIDLGERLKNYKGKKVFVAAGKDKVVPPKAVEFDAGLTESNYEIIAEAPHWVTLERQQELTDILMKYFVTF